ncbi:hypothetical protein [Butyrivibrio fibrisolvens]|uniref:hypothetical protein n=1 Tax=Butyrivibrio fibrisolvens TaxID=831 RepID=UPI0003B4D4CB|nr:hypothetical protein [Butyrivibrio fibrisolvens]
MTSYTDKGYDLYQSLSSRQDRNKRDSNVLNGNTTTTTEADRGLTNDRSDSNYIGPAAIYEGSIYIPRKVTYSQPNIIQDDPASDYKQKELLLKIEEQYEQISKDSFNGQLEAYRRNNAASVWKLLSSGDLAVGNESKNKARADVSEDGYWGSKHTSERLFDFAKTMSQKDPERIKKLRARMDRAIDAVTKEWGSELPGLCQETIQNTRRLFAEFLAKEGEMIS